MKNARKLRLVSNSNEHYTQTPNRSEDTSNAMKPVLITEEIYTEQTKEVSNKTERRDFNQHMQIVRRRTEQQFSPDTGDGYGRLKSQPKEIGQQKRKHLHLYSNKDSRVTRHRSEAHNGIGLHSTIINKNQNEVQVPTSTQNNQQTGINHTRTNQKVIVETYRFGTEQNGEIEQRQQVEYTIVKALREDSLPKMNDGLNLNQQMITNGRNKYDGDQFNADYQSVRVNQKQNNQNELGDDTTNNRNKRKTPTNEFNISNNSDSFDNGQPPNTQTQKLTVALNQQQASPRYYQPEGQRLVDEKLQQIRRKSRQIQEEIDRRTLETIKGPQKVSLQVGQPTLSNEINRSVDVRTVNISKDKQKQLNEMLVQNVFHGGRIGQGQATPQQVQQRGSQAKGQTRPPGIMMTQNFPFNGRQKKQAEKLPEILNELKGAAPQLNAIIIGQTSKQKQTSVPFKDKQLIGRTEPTQMSYQSDEQFNDSDNQTPRVSSNPLTPQQQRQIQRQQQTNKLAEQNNRQQNNKAYESQRQPSATNQPVNQQQIQSFQPLRLSQQRDQVYIGPVQDTLQPARTVTVGSPQIDSSGFSTATLGGMKTPTQQTHSLSPVRTSGVQMPQPVFYSPPYSGIGNVNQKNQNPSNTLNNRMAELAQLAINAPHANMQPYNQQAAHIRTSGVRGSVHSIYQILPHQLPTSDRNMQIRSSATGITTTIGQQSVHPNSNHFPMAGAVPIVSVNGPAISSSHTRLPPNMNQAIITTTQMPVDMRPSSLSRQHQNNYHDQNNLDTERQLIGPALAGLMQGSILDQSKQLPVRQVSQLPVQINSHVFADVPPTPAVIVAEKKKGKFSSCCCSIF